MFWRNNVQYRQNGGSKICWLDFGLKVPKFLYAATQHTSHLAGSQQLGLIDASVLGTDADDIVKMKLYNKYVNIFTTFMEQPIVQAGRINHFSPLFLFCNVNLQMNRFGGGFDLRSIDKGATTSIYLIGFYRCKRDGSNLTVLSLEGTNGGFPSITI